MTTKVVCIASVLVLTTLVELHAQVCTAVGKERWTVKTMAPLQASKPRKLTPAQIVALDPPPTAVSSERGVKKLETRYKDVVSGLREGQLVSVTGWVRFVKTSPDDCDYHIQMTPRLTDDEDMIVVEIPEGDADHVTGTTLRRLAAVARNSLKTDLHLTKEPSKSGNTIGEAFMTIEGALFFDAPHHPNCDKRGVHMHAATCWEIHPVTALRFAKRP